MEDLEMTTDRLDNSILYKSIGAFDDDRATIESCHSVDRDLEDEIMSSATLNPAL